MMVATGASEPTDTAQTTHRGSVVPAAAGQSRPAGSPTTSGPGPIPASIDWADLAAVYRDLHQHPELSFQEIRTAEVVARRLRAAGVSVHTGVGRTGVVGVIANGDGPTVLLRADMDALPVAEATGLPYASQVRALGADGIEVPVMHACGHDMHVTCLLGAADALNQTKQSWAGTLLLVFQPAEELGQGAAAMVADGLFERFGSPDVILGQHVVPLPPGLLGAHPGPAFAAADALKVTLHGRGGHGSMPQATVDAVVMAASTIMRLQTVVSREISPSDAAVLTIGSVHAGSKDNIIADQAEMLISVRSFAAPVRDQLIGAIRRITAGESAAAGAPQEPDVDVLESFPLVTNDVDATERTMQRLRDHFGESNIIDPGPLTASEDVGVLGTASGAPLVYWVIGGTEPSRTAPAAIRPGNHSPFFAPVVDQTLRTGVTALVVAALTWLYPGQGDAPKPITAN